MQMNSPRIQQFLRTQDAFTAQVSGACMAPRIGEGDQVQIRRRPLYLPGDVVAFTNARGECVCHRLLGYVRHRGQWNVITKADSTSRTDGLTPAGAVLGRVERVNRAEYPVAPRLRAAALWHWSQTLLQALTRRAGRPNGGRAVSNAHDR
jgi:hypothetical protein